MDGAQQIVIPAFVTLLCLVHRVRADVPARRRRRLSVPAAGRGRGVRADRLLHPVAHAGADHGQLSHARPSCRQRPCIAEGVGTAAAPSRNPLQALSARVRAIASRACARATARCCRSRSAVPRPSSRAFSPASSCRSASGRSSGENFFPAVDSGQILMHVRAQPGTRIEETARLFDLVEQTIREHHPARSARQHRRQYRPAVLRHQHGLSEHRHDRPGGRRRPDQPQGRPSRRPRTIVQASCAPCCRRNFPARPSRSCPPTSSRRFSISACRRRSTCRSSATIRPPTTPTPPICSSASAPSPGIADPRIQQVFNYPQINVDVDRTLAGEVGLTQRDIANSLLVTLSGSAQVQPNFWLNPENGVSYPIVAQMPQYRVDTMSDLVNVPVTSAETRRRRNISAASRPITPGPSSGRGLALQRAAGDRHLRRGPGPRSRRGVRRHRSHPAGDAQGRAARLLCRDRAARCRR